eukprot:TRINITY_DN37030_c0_g1_i1.p3 TRINITY_DN37030_c0_g1~~TRINITY_DN37030_c0_g1_i1.p3  ORF type:complete len:108 (+),score=7.75 TRINITY_DN37030_c0_g1_i1:352-675(+)
MATGQRRSEGWRGAFLLYDKAVQTKKKKKKKLWFCQQETVDTFLELIIVFVWHKSLKLIMSLYQINLHKIAIFGNILTNLRHNEVSEINNFDFVTKSCRYYCIIRTA